MEEDQWVGKGALPLMAVIDITADDGEIDLKEMRIEIKIEDEK